MKTTTLKVLACTMALLVSFPFAAASDETGVGSDASPRETTCNAVRERADIQEGLSMLHDIDKSLAKVNAEYARVKKLNADTPKDLGGLVRAVEERQRDLSNKKTKLLGGVPCLAELYNAEQH